MSSSTTRTINNKEYYASDGMLNKQSYKSHINSPTRGSKVQLARNRILVERTIYIHVVYIAQLYLFFELMHFLKISVLVTPVNNFQLNRIAKGTINDSDNNLSCNIDRIIPTLPKTMSLCDHQHNIGSRNQLN